MTNPTLERVLWGVAAWISLAAGVAAMSWAMDFDVVTNPRWLKAWAFIMAMFTTTPAAGLCLHKAILGVRK